MFPPVALAPPIASPESDLLLPTSVHLERATFMPLHLTPPNMAQKPRQMCVPEIIPSHLIRIASANRLAGADPLAPRHRHGHFDSSSCVGSRSYSSFPCPRRTRLEGYAIGAHRRASSFHC